MRRSDRAALEWLGLALAGMLAMPAWGATFTVDSLGDFSDDDLGDDICETVRGNIIDGFTLDCSLRGAIEQANASAGVDTIEFSVAGVVRPSSGLGALPMIVEAVIIDGSTAPGAPIRDRDLGLNPVSPAPTLFIDGANLGGAPAGLHATARGVEIYNLGITGFGGAGLRLALAAGPEETIISGNWIGQASDRGAAANGSGIDVSSAGTVSVLIGHDGTSLAGTGRGNVISGNLGVGLIGLVSGVTARGNWIGSAGDGSLSPELGGSAPTAVPNGGPGVSLTGTGNALNDNEIVGNGDPQVLLRGADSVATSNDIFGVILDPAVLQDPESVVPGPSDALRVLGPNSEVRNNDAWANQNGIVLDSMAGGAPDLGGEVIGNSAVLNALDGIVLAGVAQVTMDENELVLNRGYGARIETADNLIRGNTVGRAISATEGLGNYLGGLLISGDDNVLTETPVGMSGEEPNSILLNGGPGITVTGDGNTIDANGVGFNEGAGLVIDSAVATVVSGNLFTANASGPAGDGNGVVLTGSASGSLIQRNFLWGNEGAAVKLDATAGEANQIIANLYVGNAGISIDLGGEGETGNDANDADAGTNRLQNYPVLGNLSFDPGASPPTVTVDYTVDTTAANSTLPLTLEFYYADGAFERGGASLHDSLFFGGMILNPYVGYPDPPALNSVTLELPDGTVGGALRSIAIDADGNTSEFSPAIEFGEIDDSLFIDGFEGSDCRVICPITDPDCVMCRL